MTRCTHKKGRRGYNQPLQPVTRRCGYRSPTANCLVREDELSGEPFPMGLRCFGDVRGSVATDRFFFFFLSRGFHSSLYLSCSPSLDPLDPAAGTRFNGGGGVFRPRVILGVILACGTSLMLSPPSDRDSKRRGVLFSCVLLPWCAVPLRILTHSFTPQPCCCWWWWWWCVAGEPQQGSVSLRSRAQAGASGADVHRGYRQAEGPAAGA